jgi:hypothetical protein
MRIRTLIVGTTLLENPTVHFWSSPECLSTSSARILLRMNSASLATRTMWSFMAWESRRPSLMSSMKASPACFCSEFCHSWNRNPYVPYLLGYCPCFGSESLYRTYLVIIRVLDRNPYNRTYLVIIRFPDRNPSTVLLT